MAAKSSLRINGAPFLGDGARGLDTHTRKLKGQLQTCRLIEVTIAALDIY
jgi:hypothetical protein